MRFIPTLINPQFDFERVLQYYLLLHSKIKLKKTDEAREIDSYRYDPRSYYLRWPSRKTLHFTVFPPSGIANKELGSCIGAEASFADVSDRAFCSRD